MRPGLGRRNRWLAAAALLAASLVMLLVAFGASFAVKQNKLDACIDAAHVQEGESFTYEGDHCVVFSRSEESGVDRRAYLPEIAAAHRTAEVAAVLAATALGLAVVLVCWRSPDSQRSRRTGQRP